MNYLYFIDYLVIKLNYRISLYLYLEYSFEMITNRNFISFIFLVQALISTYLLNKSRI